MLHQLNFPPDDAVYEIRDEYLRPFGFTLYRTDHDSSDEIWHTFLERLQSDLMAEFSRTFEGEQQQDQDAQQATEKLRSLVRIDARSDAALLNNRTIDELRTIFRDRVGGDPISVDDGLTPHILVADAEVLDAASRGERWVKLVEINYDANNYRAFIFRKPGPLSFLGWAKMATNSLLFARARLDQMELNFMLAQGRNGSNIADDFPVLEHGKNVE
ncbi:hypothetical protein PWT90_03383 [Aphanocladium album]|nr:hypothetical protein PWT90_03383 [Aphanocladium album]